MAAKSQPENGREALETAVRKQRQFVELVELAVERNAGDLSAEQVNKAFDFITIALNSARQRSLLALNTGGLANFSLDAELPAVAPIVPPQVQAPARIAQVTPEGFGRFGGSEDDLSELEDLENEDLPEGFAPDGTRLVGFRGKPRPPGFKPVRPKAPTPEQLAREDLEDGAGFLDE